MKRAHYAVVSGMVTATFFGAVGCGSVTSNPSSNHSNQVNATPTSSGLNSTGKAEHAPTEVIQSIEPKPSGLLIKLGDQATSATKKIVDVQRITGSNLSLTLQNVRLANPSVVKVNEIVGNQLILKLKTKEHGANLIVNMTLMQPVNKINVGTSGSYLGIALQYKPAKSMSEPHPVGSIPSWFFKDILTAASIQGTPVLAKTYGAMLPFQSSDQTYMLKAPFTGSYETLGFSAYFGTLPLYQEYINVLNTNSNGTENLFTQVKYGYIRELEKPRWSFRIYGISRSRNPTGYPA